MWRAHSAPPRVASGELGDTLRPVPVASLRLLSIALYYVDVDGAPVYNAAGCALTARCPLAQLYRFGS